MASYQIPLFEKGSILTSEMMERLKEYAVDLHNLQYQGYSDGIVSGCELQVVDQSIMMKPGIFCMKNEIYFVDQEIKVSFSPKNIWNAVKIRLGSKVKEKGFTLQELELMITEDLEERDSQIELARFRLQSGAMLRSNYRNFQDVSTEYDTLNIIYANWAAYGRTSVSGKILELFAKEAIQKGIQNTEDYLFVQQILTQSGKTINRTSIELYISKRLQRPMKELSNEEIYRGLCEVLKVFQSGTTMQRPSRMREDRRIIVD